MGDSMVDKSPSSQEGVSKPLSQRVIETVAEAESVDPTELTPLFSVVDPDVLDTLFRPQRKAGEVPDATAEVRFSYHGYEVRATAAGRVSLTEHEEKTE